MPPKKVIEKKGPARLLAHGGSATGSRPYTMWTGIRIDGSSIPSGVYFSLAKLRNVLRLVESTGSSMSMETQLSDWQRFNENSESLVATLTTVEALMKKLSATAQKRRAAFRVRYLSFLETLHSKANERSLIPSEPLWTAADSEPPSLTTSETLPASGEDSRSTSQSAVKDEPATPPSGVRTSTVPPAPAKLERSGRASRTQISSMPFQQAQAPPGLTDTDLDITQLY